MNDVGAAQTEEEFIPETGALAWTPDEEIEAGVQRFKELWPDKWEAWVAWCRAEDEKYKDD